MLFLGIAFLSVLVGQVRLEAVFTLEVSPIPEQARSLSAYMQGANGLSLPLKCDSQGPFRGSVWIQQ